MLAFVFLSIAWGCSPSDIDRAYGKRRGSPGGSSVNGTAVLAAMFERAGHRVTTWRRLSPKLDNFDVIVWAPDDFSPPNKEQRDFLESWLQDREDRTLVYIGRDYDAGVAYWNAILPQSPSEQAFEVSRRLATVQAEHDAERARMPAEDPCGWFTLRRAVGVRRASSLQGPWSAGVDAPRSAIDVAARLDTPTAAEIAKQTSKTAVSPSSRYRYEPLLRSGTDNLVTRVYDPDWNGSRILVVVNGSFLLNLPLVNHEHRKLAGRLISACGPAGRVVFLESGPGGPRVYKKEPDREAPTGFELLTLWPIGLILLHLIVLGITLCFVFHPVFGRPRPHRASSSPSDFGQHVEAFGELFEATGDVAFARERVRLYQEQVKREPGVVVYQKR